MAKRKATKTHPMITAVLNEMPAPGPAWPAAERAAWLRMLAMSFDVVYGPTSAIAIGAQALPVSSAAMAPVSVRAVVDKANPPRFFIDKEGFARRDPGGIRVVPEHVDDVIFDDRGEAGDLGAIIWADGRVGVLGLQLEISAIPEKTKAAQ